MLEKIREGSTGLAAKIILGLVVLSFVFAGVGSYINSSGNSAAATVNEEEISLRTFDRAYQSERARMESQLGDMFNQLIANDEYLKSFRQDVMQKLVDEKLMEQSAIELGLRVSNTEILQTIADMPEFQLGGQFNNDRFQAILTQAGFAPSDFKTYMRRQMTRQQLARALVMSDFALTGEVESMLRLQKQTRDGHFVQVPAEMFVAEVSISDEDRENYYLNNISDFDTQEQVKASYVELKVDDLLNKVSVSADDIALYYEENQANYRVEEERRASHILIETGDDAAAAEQKAQDVLSQINGGADFAELAKTESDDTFSGEQGGDLDWFGKGIMDPAFEEAAFALQSVGDVSEVVESEFGFHIIKLTDIKPEQIEPLVDVSEDIEQRLLREAATERFIEIQQSMSQVAFEMPDTLDEVAAVAEKSVQQSEFITRNSASDVLADAAVLNELFSPELIEDRVNSDVIDINDEHVVFVRVDDYKAQRTQSQEEVQDQINVALTQQKAQQLALEWAQSVTNLIKDDMEAAQAKIAEKGLVSTEITGSARYGSDNPAEVIQTLFKLDNSHVVDAIEMGNGDVAVVHLTNINEVEQLDDAEITASKQRMASNYGQTVYTSLLKVLNADAEVKINNLAAQN
ncbi:MAG: SurA N-terminal domain-containing protein [Aestuariibacter sp.]